MEPEFGRGLGPDRSGGAPRRPRPTVFVRVLEMSGLAVLAYALGTYRFGFAALGGAMIVASYAIYRRKHGGGAQTGPDRGGDGPNGDGGDD